MKKILNCLGLCVVLSGCAAPLLIGGAVGVGGIAVADKGGKNIIEYDAQVSRMSCSQLRTEYTKQKNAPFNPFGQSTSKLAIVNDVMQRRGCSYPKA